MYLRLGKINIYITMFVKLPTPDSDKTREIYKYYKMVRYSPGDLCTVRRSGQQGYLWSHRQVVLAYVIF